MDIKNKKCLIIFNPISGKGTNANILKEYQKILNARGYEVDLISTKHNNHATEIMEHAGDYDIVFSIGGDGTLNEVIRGNYLRKDRLTICPLPSGTCNDVATMLGYGKNPIDNLKKALDGEINTIDIGTVNNKPFVYVAGMGKLMNIPYETKSEEKRKNGYLAYIKASLGEIFNAVERYKAEVIVDGIKLDEKYSLIMVSNSNHIAGINNFYKNVCLNDGKMEVILCTAENKRQFIINFLKFFSGQPTTDIVSLKAREVSIKLFEIPEKNWCVDGEKYNYYGDEYHIKIDDNMKILVPKTKVKKLFRNENGANRH